jgi:hypothetical protein
MVSMQLDTSKVTDYSLFGKAEPTRGGRPGTRSGVFTRLFSDYFCSTQGTSDDSGREDEQPNADCNVVGCKVHAQGS